MSKSKILNANIANDRLYMMSEFFDFDWQGTDTKFEEVTSSSATIVLSSGGGGTGALRLSTGSLEDSVAQIGSTMAWAMYDYDRVVEFAARIAVTDTGDNNHAIMCGLGYPVSVSIWETDAYIDYTNKELAIFYKKPSDENWWCVTSSNSGGAFTETRSAVKCGQQYSNSPNGAETLRVMLHKERGDITRVRFYHDPLGYGSFEPVVDEFNKPIVHIRDESSGLTSQKMGLSITNKTASHQRVWIDWWALNATRGDITSDAPDPWPDNP